MRHLIGRFAAAAILAATLAQSAQGQITPEQTAPGQAAPGQGGAVYIATYVEVMANAMAPGVSTLEQYRDASRQQDGSLRFDVLQEINRPNRFAIIEIWRDRAALDAHAKAANTLQFREKLKAIETAAPDEHINNLIAVGKGQSAAGPGTIYVVTHVDVVASGKDDCEAALKALAIESAGDPGNVDYEASEQANHGNHFTVIEAWVDKDALAAHAAAAHTRAFREKIIPFIGAPYDDRLYTALR
jgi:quinol monooxygenase YgiN